MCCNTHFIGSFYVTGSTSSPDEDRLLKHLFDPDHQPHNLMTTPIANISETVNVTVGIEIVKVIALVRVFPRSLVNTIFQ